MARRRSGRGIRFQLMVAVAVRVVVAGTFILLRGGL
jgi:hypothetical protein